MEAEWREYACAYCGETNETFVDPTAGLKQLYVEDCEVCCRPNVVKVSIMLEDASVDIEALIEE